MLELAIYSAIAPFVLLLVSSVWSYPMVLEEVVKWGILKLAANSQQLTVKQGALVGVVFGLSEAVIFSMNVWMNGDWTNMMSRLLLTVPMHAVSASATAWGMTKGLAWVGLVLAVAIHAGFNYLVA